MANKYICSICRSTFREPVVYIDDGITEYGKVAILSCPCCGEESDFIEADNCPECGTTKDKSEKLCTNCKAHLRARFRRFRDNLSLIEEEVLDDWLDGESIKSI